MACPVFANVYQCTAVPVAAEVANIRIPLYLIEVFEPHLDYTECYRWLGGF